jgi:hypothetical protein
MLFTLLVLTLIGADTLMAGSATIVLALALLSAGVGSFTLLVTLPESLRLPSSAAWAVTVMVAVPPDAIVPSEKVMTLPEREKLPWLVVAEV